MEQNDSTLFVSSRDAAGLNQRVYEHILRQIIEVQIEPGERINVTKIAEQLQISRTPIRSAMDQLVKDGLIKRVSDRGYQVTLLIWLTASICVMPVRSWRAQPLLWRQ
ncbi:MAG: GntR family transcriptional regulator [Neglectibacter sp.]